MRNKRANSIRIAVHATGAPFETGTLSEGAVSRRRQWRAGSHGHREALHAPLNRPPWRPWLV